MFTKDWHPTLIKFGFSLHMGRHIYKWLWRELWSSATAEPRGATRRAATKVRFYGTPANGTQKELQWEFYFPQGKVLSAGFVLQLSIFLPFFSTEKRSKMLGVRFFTVRQKRGACVSYSHTVTRCLAFFIASRISPSRGISGRTSTPL